MTGADSYRLAVASRRGVALGIATAALGAAGVFLAWRIFVATAQGQRVEQWVMTGAQYGSSRLWQVAEPILEIVSIPAVALVLLAAVVIAVLVRRWMLAVQVLVLVIGANLTTQILKYWIFTYPNLGVTYARDNSLPSGHVTVAASVAVAAVLVVPPRARPIAAVVGALYATATGVSTLVGQWHRPSDVVAALFVVLAWGGIAVVLSALGRRGSLRRRDEHGREAPAAHPGGDIGHAARSHSASGEGRADTDGRRRRSTGTVAGALVLFAGALVTGFPAATALHMAWTSAELASRSELLTVYAGSALGVASTACLVFAWLLVVRHFARSAPRSA